GLGAEGSGIVADIWRPLRTLLFAGERAAFGLDPLGWHVTSLLLHVLNSLLVLRVLAGLCAGLRVPAVVGALAFAVHPVGVESVAWVSAQGDLLAVTFMLLALWVLEAAGAWRSALGAALCALACLSKESAVVLPGLLWLRDRVRDPVLALPAGVRWRRVALLGAVVGGYLLARAQVLPGELAQVAGPGIDLSVRVRAFLSALAWHAGSLLWPTGFRFEADLPVPLGWGEPGVVVGLGLLLTLLALAVRAWRSPRPGLALWWAAGSLVALVPVAQVLVPLKTLAAERFLYPVLPCAVAGLCSLALGLSRTRARWAAPALALLALPLALVSRQRCEAWHDEASLWDAVRRDRPSNARAYEGLGFGLFAQGRFQDAERAYLSYLQFQPYDGKARRRLADHLGNLVRTLVSSDPEVVRNTSLVQGRSAMQALQVAMLRSALACWAEVGYEAGRGSRALEVDTLVRLRDATMDLGDLSGAKEANDTLLRSEGVDPARREEVQARGGLDARTCRWFLAWMATSTPSGRWTGEERVRRQAQRALVLRDAGLDPEQPDEVLRRALEAPLAALRMQVEQVARTAALPAERSRAAGRALDLLLLHAELLESTGRVREAEPLRREAQARRLLGEVR
ncbi:MAG: hypothetical protein ACKOSS_11810, partial [Planctomycetia bacterium]